MREFERILIQILDAILRIFGEVLGIFVRLLNDGYTTYMHSGLTGKVLGVIIMILALWLLGWLMRFLFEGAARFAIPLLLVILVVALLISIADNNGHIVLR